jgi:ribose transport system permease protein
MSGSTATTGGAVATGGRNGDGKHRGPGFMAGPAGRQLGLVIALAILCIVGVITAGDRFLDIDNVLTILKLAAVIGVVSIGMTFVIIAGGIDLSVGALVALSSVWATTLATQRMAEDTHWTVMVLTAIAVGGGAGLVNGIVIAYGRIVAFIATLAMLAAARGLAEILANKRTQIVQDRDYLSFFSGDVLDGVLGEDRGIPTLVIIWVLVSIVGWILLNRTTFGRHTFAVGGNAEAARLAGIRVQRHTLKIYVLSGIACGIAAAMLMGRTTTGTSTHGTLYELDAIAAVVIGGTLLIGGRGTIVGTVLGVLIFQTLSNVFVLNNLSSSAQAVAKGVIIVLAVLLQTRLAAGGGPGSWFGRRRPPAAAGGPLSTGAASGDVSGGTSVPGAPGGDRPGSSDPTT